jgi:threonine dehydratase
MWMDTDNLRRKALLSLKEIKDAAHRIEGAANRTPVMTSRTLDRLCGARVYLKCENYQRAGAFKFRGAFNAVSQLTASERSAGVVTHSSGNHAQALALAAATAGVRAKIVMPEGSPAVKREAVKGYGAEVVLCANTLEARERTAEALIRTDGLTMVHPYNDERVMAGAGTAALELIEQAGPLDLVLVPVGGGGLASGTATAVKALCPEAAVWAVEPAGADDACRSLQSGRIVPQTDPRTIADGLRTSLGSLTFEVIRTLVDRIVLVRDEDIVDSMRFLWERMKLVVEPSGAVPLVPVLKKELPAGRDLRVGVIISGGNVDLARFFEGYGKA